MVFFGRSDFELISDKIYPRKQLTSALSYKYYSKNWITISY